MTVGIVTDSAAALPSDVASTAGVTVVPLRVTIGDASRREIDVSLDELVARYAEGVTTSGPTPGEIRQAVEVAIGGDGVLVLTVARRFSGVYDAARAAVAGEFGSHVRVMDTDTAAAGQALVVLAAATRARTGGTLDEVEAHARDVAERVRLVASLRDLDWLVRGGHVPQVAAWTGRSLRLRPMIELRRGRIRPLRPTTSDSAVIQRIVSLWRASRPASDARAHVVAMHALGADRAERILTAIRAETKPATALIGSFGSVMVAHTGPELVGLGWWWEEVRA